MCFSSVCFLQFTDIFHSSSWKNLFGDIPEDLTHLVHRLPQVLMNSKAKNTFKTYNSYFKSWCQFCDTHGFPSIPAQPHHIAVYLTSYAQDSFSLSKLNALVYSISWAHTVAGFQDPCKSSLVVQTKEGLARILAKPKAPKQPISPEHVLKIVSVYGFDANLMNSRLVVMCLLSYAGFLRFDELINLRMNDIVFQDSYIKIFIRKSKTDQYKSGSDVVIAKTGLSTCPVYHLSKYVELAGLKADSDEFLFRQMTFCKSESRYLLKQGPPISYSRAREILLEKLSALGLDASTFGLHSMRRGGATSVANSGQVNDRVFKKHGRWKSDSSKDGYIVENDEQRKSVSLNLGI